MAPRLPHELLYDSEAVLRAVDSAVAAVGAEYVGTLPDATAATVPRGDGHAERLIEQGQVELLAVLESLRQTRVAIERPAMERLTATGDTLREVSFATERAASSILDGIERALDYVSQLDALAADDGNGQGTELRTALRDELYSLVAQMQFQDITSQQLTFASAVLHDTERRLTALSQMFDLGTALANSALQDPLLYDPNATTMNRDSRQAVADALLATRKSRLQK